MSEAMIRNFGRVIAVLGMLVVAATTLPALGQPQAVRIAVHTSLGGEDDPLGRSYLDGVRFAIDEANESGIGPHIELDIYSDKGTEQGAREVAEKIAASRALLVVGPLLSTSSVAAGPAFAKAGIASIVAAAESDRVTDAATTFQSTFRNSDLAVSYAGYLRYALNGRRAAVIFVDDAYGRTLADGFRRGAEWLGITATFHGFVSAKERDEAVRQVAADPDKPVAVLGMLQGDAWATIKGLRRQGFTPAILGGTDVSESSFAVPFRSEPEERREPHFFSRALFGAVPVMLDSANAQTLEFVERFKKQRGDDPLRSTWVVVQAYDAGQLAVAAVRKAAQTAAGGDVAARRAEVLKFLTSLDAPSRGVPGLLGPIWFQLDRGRELPIRVGRFEGGRFESAPLQLVPVARPSREELASGAEIEIAPGRYAQRQQVVYAGIYLNEIPRLDLVQSTFTADLYVWVRSPRDVTSGDADPTQIEFPDMVRGTFDKGRVAGQRELSDGTTYRLWRLTGDFKNDFDLRRYPADRQRLQIRFYNSRASSSQLVYAIDDDPSLPGDPAAGGVSAEAFRNLTQWEPRSAIQARDALVTHSALGDPERVGAERVRELSGFSLEVDVQRRLGTTLIKTLLPIGLMTLIMFATLFLPPALASSKVTVGITAALSGAVLLSAINSQLGNVGYVIAVEYGFYVFFALCLLCILTVLIAERQRIAGHPQSALTVERAGRAAFLTIFVVTTIAAVLAAMQWQ
jgi:ABC-type branched-subunit amino acid transport system substrate-binding protein